ncbi:efflux transporter outer membrane subunit [Pseudomonas oryzihabitans]|uniref:efflux transporter outer membrane subunit n=1 Tax=Pseudomonas oryzihabitans TaxID=47885 RepID=UPI00285F1DFE|nr:efflux transporter outer membrane subunit [Pseudomonas psychrotolerans]MDR6676208.1 multidrug efflux system outer membrane protein [Pseudomonas psychrotolerans]
MSVAARFALPSIALAALLGLAGCSLIPAYQRPALPIPAQQGQHQRAAVPTADLALSQDERRLLAAVSDEALLPELVAQALAGNRDYRITQLRVEQARAQLGLRQAERWPTLGLAVQRPRQRFADPALDDRYQQDLATATFGTDDFELDFFGRLASLGEAARHQLLASEYGQQAARGALVAEVARLFLLAREADAQVASSQAIAALSDQLVQRTQARISAGELPTAALEPVSQAALESGQQARQALAQRAQAYQALAWVSGYRLSPAPSAPRPLSTGLPEAPGELADLPSTRLLERLDVRAAEERLQAANASIGAARAAFLPSIRLSTAIGLASPDLQSLLSAGHGLRLLTPSLSLPLFDGGRNQANLDAARIERDLAVAAYERTLQDAFREVADGLEERRQLLDQWRSGDAQVRLARERSQRLERQWQAGAGSPSAILQAALDGLRRTAAWRQADHALRLNRLRLYRALHGLDNPSAT